MTSMSQSGQRFSVSLFKTPEEKAKRRGSSNDPFFTRSLKSAHIREFSTGDMSTRYSISYLPGVSEHFINTGKTLEEAQLKIVLFACEVERLNTQNYELVKENEVLRVQMNKSQREQDLETKLAIVLAENEKLNQVVEELYNLYMAQRNAENQSDFDKKIAQLLQDLDEWKERYNNLQDSQNHSSAIHESLKGLEEENLKLKDIIERKDREFEILKTEGVRDNERILEKEKNEKVKTTSNNSRLEGQATVTKGLKDKLEVLLANNENLNSIIQKQLKQIEDLKAGQGQAENLLRNIDLVTRENDRLNTLLREKLQEVESLRKQKDEFRAMNIRFEELNIKVKNLLNQNTELNNLAAEKQNEVDKLNQRLEQVEGHEKLVNQLKEKIIVLVQENEKLNNMVMEKAKDVELLKSQVSEVKSVKEKNQSGIQSKELMEENQRLNYLVTEKMKENEELREKLSELHDAMVVNEDLQNKIQLTRRENEMLNKVIFEKAKEVEQLKVKISETLNSSVVLNDWKTKFVLVCSENERLNSLLNRSQVKTNTLSGPAEEIKVKITLKSQGNEKLLIDEVREIGGRYSETGTQENSGRIKELEDRLRIVSAENEKLNRLVLERVREIEEMKVKLNELKTNTLGRSQTLETETLKVRIQSLAQDNQRLNDALLDKSREIERLKKEVYELETRVVKVSQLEEKLVLVSSENQRLLQELEGLRKRQDDERNKVLEMKIEELLLEKKSMEVVMKAKTEDVEALKNELEAIKNEHLNVVETFNHSLKQQNEELKNAGVNQQMKSGELESRKRQVAELEQKIETMEGEIKKLVEIIALKDTESNNLRIAIAQVEETRKNLKNEKEWLLSVIAEKEKEVEIIKRDTATEMEKIQVTMDEKLHEEKQRFAKEKGELESDIYTLTEENKHLKIQIDQRLIELENLKKKHIELEMLRNQEINEYKEQFEDLKLINKEIKDLQVKAAAERMAYETQIAQLRMKLNDVEHQRDLLLSENERLTTLNIQRSEETEKVARKSFEIEEVYNLEISSLKNELENCKIKESFVKEIAIKYSADKAADQVYINQLKSLNENYQAEITKLYELLNERKADIEIMQKQNEELRQSQASIMTRFSKDSASEEYVSKEKIESMQKEVERLENAKNEYKKQAERNQIELTRRNKELVEKIQELDILKLKYEEAFANYQALNAKLFERLSIS